jgi:hypothetical protein
MGTPSEPRCQRASVPTCLGANVPQCLGASVPQCLGASVPRCQRASVPTCLGANVPTRKASGAPQPTWHWTSRQPGRRARRDVGRAELLRADQVPDPAAVNVQMAISEVASILRSSDVEASDLGCGPAMKPAIRQAIMAPGSLVGPATGWAGTAQQEKLGGQQEFPGDAVRFRYQPAGIVGRPVTDPPTPPTTAVQPGAGRTPGRHQARAGGARTTRGRGSTPQSAALRLSRTSAPERGDNRRPP